MRDGLLCEAGSTESLVPASAPSVHGGAPLLHPRHRRRALARGSRAPGATRRGRVTGMRVVVAGAGASGLALAAGLTSAGHEVVLFETQARRDRVARLMDGGAITVLEPGGASTVSPAVVTCDPFEAFAAADVLLVTVPPGERRAFGELLLPLVEPRHVLVLTSGALDALAYAHWLLARGRWITGLATFAATDFEPYACRRSGPDAVRIHARAAPAGPGGVPGVEDAGDSPAPGAAPGRAQRLSPCRCGRPLRSPGPAAVHDAAVQCGPCGSRRGAVPPVRRRVHPRGGGRARDAGRRAPGSGRRRRLPGAGARAGAARPPGLGRRATCGPRFTRAGRWHSVRAPRALDDRRAG